MKNINEFHFVKQCFYYNILYTIHTRNNQHFNPTIQKKKFEKITPKIFNDYNVD